MIRNTGTSLVQVFVPGYYRHFERWFNSIHSGLLLALIDETYAHDFGIKAASATEFNLKPPRGYCTDWFGSDFPLVFTPQIGKL